LIKKIHPVKFSLSHVSSIPWNTSQKEKLLLISFICSHNNAALTSVSDCEGISCPKQQDTRVLTMLLLEGVACPFGSPLV